MEFHEHLTSDSRLVPCWETDGGTGAILKTHLKLLSAATFFFSECFAFKAVIKMLKHYTTSTTILPITVFCCVCEGKGREGWSWEVPSQPLTAEAFSCRIRGGTIRMWAGLSSTISPVSIFPAVLHPQSVMHRRRYVISTLKSFVKEYEKIVCVCACVRASKLIAHIKVKS